MGGGWTEHLTEGKSVGCEINPYPLVSELGLETSGNGMLLTNNPYKCHLIFLNMFLAYSYRNILHQGHHLYARQQLGSSKVLSLCKLQLLC